MCGIAGIVDTRGRRPIDEGLLRRMSDRQHHRGPDAEGLHLEPGLGLGHKRLSIIDLSGGSQPLWNEDKSVVTVYNGEIFNFQALTAELAAAGHVFRTRCDTEVIVHAWEQWGSACVEHFRGQFAFALWDCKRETLLLGRDRLGIKPLHYSLLPDGTLLFASELKALLVHPALRRELDPHAVEDYFAYGYVPDPRTILRGVHKLAPGHTLTARRGSNRLAPRRYWDVPFRASGKSGESETGRELIERLREAVRIRLLSDVPLGAFLSGGVDSGAVVAMMAGLSKEPVNTCSISFGDPRFNEAQYAAEVARRFGTEHFVEQVEPDGFDLIDRLADLYDEPFADSSALPTYRVCELARRRVTVALSGDGGDENFAGYRRYRWHASEERVRTALPAALRRAVFGTLGRIYPELSRGPRVLRARSTFQAFALDTVDGYFDIVSVCGDALRKGLFSDSFRRDLQGYEAQEVLRAHARTAPTDDAVSLVQYLDMKTYLPGDILTKVDRASMAHSLEVRVPILDHELVEWVSGLPSSLKLRGRQGKYIFKRALEPHLPRQILYRPKMGFAVPLAQWFRGPLRERARNVVLGPVLAGTGLFDRSSLQRLFEAHVSGAGNHSGPIWSLLMFDAFCRRVLVWA